VASALGACGGGGAANAVDAGAPDANPFCMAPEPPTAASVQTRARVGAVFFDGWTGPLSNFHFDGLLSGAYTDREPLTGWLDSAPCVIEDEIATMRAFGVDFVVFDWYYGVRDLTNGDDQLNSGFEIMRSLPDRHGVQYALYYIADTYGASADQWPDLVGKWDTYFQDPGYVRVNGKPLVFVGAPPLRKTFGSSSAVATALGALRAAAQAKGLPGVYIVAGFAPPYMYQVGAMEDVLAQDFTAEGYDALNATGYPGSFGPGAVERPFSSLATVARWSWSETANFGALPQIPVSMVGWDSRPWNGATQVWYTRSPSEVAALLTAAIDFVDSTPSTRVEPPPAPPIVLLDAWNEMGEGHYFAPTSGDGRAYGEAIAAALAAPAPRSRTILTVDANGSGLLTDAAGAPVAGAAVAVTATATDGQGLYGTLTLADQVITDTPLGAPAKAVVGFRVNTELQPPATGPGASDFALYQVSFQEGDGAERVPDPNFADGSGWSIGHQAQLVPSDRGAGKMVKVNVTSSQQAELTSSSFAVDPGAAFRLTVSARVAPASAGSGAFIVIFLNKDGMEIGREWIPFASAHAPIGMATTDAKGAYGVSLAAIGAAPALVEASFAGDASRYPARATITK
jgi:hypothetical protein